MNIFIIAGERSGDEHAAHLIRELLEEKPDIQISGMGGDSMQAVGCHLVRHIKDMAFMGITAVLKNIRKVRENFRIARNSLLELRPDILILVDYPSFNLQIASFCRKHLPSTKIFYYIPPKVWAWKTWRIHRLARVCDEILSILPFEPDFYARYGYRATYVGNPTYIHSQLSTKKLPSTLNSQLSTLNYIALLPGSRKHEVEKCLPRMLEAALKQEGYQIVIAAVSSLDKQIYDKALQPYNGRADIKLLYDCSGDILRSASAAVVNSGTATLEAALAGCVQVAVYHIGLGYKPIYKLLRPLLFRRIKYFTLVNLIAGREVIQELIAYRFTIDNLAHELNQLLTDDDMRQKQQDGYKEIAVLLSQTAAPSAAQIVICSTNQHESPSSLN